MANLRIQWVAQEMDDAATLSADVISGAGVTRVDLPANTVVEVPDLDAGAVHVAGRLPSGRMLRGSLSLPTDGSSETFELGRSTSVDFASPRRARMRAFASDAPSASDGVAELMERGWLRLWVYVADDASPWKSIALMDPDIRGLDPNGVAVRMRGDWGTKPAFLELGGLGPLSTFAAVPPVDRFVAHVGSIGDGRDVDPEAGPEIALDLASLDPRHASIDYALQAMDGGAMESARATFTKVMRRLLIEKFIDPFGAMAGCYFLLRCAEIDELQDMPERLFEAAAPESPDSALLFAWQQMLLLSAHPEQKEDRLPRFKSALLEAVRRGVPIFSLGLNFVFEQIRSLEVSAGDKQLGNLVSKAAKRFGERLDATDEGSILTTFTGTAPWSPMSYSRLQFLQSKDPQSDELEPPKNPSTRLDSLR